MIGSLVILTLICSAVLGARLRIAQRRRADQVPVITTWPDIELSQRYGGWDADAYDAGTGRASASHFVPPLHLPSGARLPGQSTQQR